MPATVKGGFWPENGVATLNTAHTTGPHRRRIQQQFSKKGNRYWRELATTLNGVAAGAAASETQTRIAASAELGGVRAIETETLLSRVTVAQDVTDLNADFFSPLMNKTYDSTPPANLDGNPLGTR